MGFLKCKNITVTNIFNDNINSRQKKNNGGGTTYKKIPLRWWCQLEGAEAD